MIINLKNYIKDIRIKYFIPIKNIDSDFWERIYRYELEEVK